MITHRLIPSGVTITVERLDTKVWKARAPLFIPTEWEFVGYIGKMRVRKLKASGIPMNRGKSDGWEFGKKPK
jgi:hypothetical protein